MTGQSKNKYNQISESIVLGSVLSLSGGFMDAYTYICREHVFANAQTGNILLLGINISEGKWSAAIRYFFPVFAFALGIAISEMVRHSFKENHHFLHWRQITLLAEILILIPVGFCPQSLNLLANCLVSFACGIQVESFRKIHGTTIATTMCIGNLRAATELFAEFTYSRDKQIGRKSLLYFAMIIIFMFGAILGNFAVNLWKEYAILLSCLLMFIGFLLMFIHKEDQVFSN